MFYYNELTTITDIISQPTNTKCSNQASSPRRAVLPSPFLIFKCEMFSTVQFVQSWYREQVLIPVVCASSSASVGQSERHYLPRTATQEHG
ncbi:hypothetical protein T11_4067 [Trichinella zimbabwensis]|uniref:Uncharacterized protein n=1 Tax=Trichinella zimbabwensis TaxID=268475 RepID=A0A0V1I0W1_9BILA|nr:hypothetical protein T11_4067 [Trichinella zimbabwensis]